MIGEKDFDHLAKQLGYDSMKAVREERLAEAQRRAEEEQEAQLKAVMEERERVRQAEDQEISEALKDRMAIQLNGEMYKEANSHEEVVCPECGKLPNFMRETLLLCVRRATFRGELRMPVWWRSASNNPYDTVPTGAKGDGLKVLAPSHLYQGNATCTECGKELDIRIEVACEHDGQIVKSIKRTKGVKA